MFYVSKKPLRAREPEEHPAQKKIFISGLAPVGCRRDERLLMCQVT